MEQHVIRVNAGERIDITQRSGGLSIQGPALVIVVKEESVAGTTDLSGCKFVNGLAFRETE